MTDAFERRRHVSAYTCFHGVIATFPGWDGFDNLQRLYDAGFWVKVFLGGIDCGQIANANSERGWVTIVTSGPRGVQFDARQGAVEIRISR